MKKRNIICLLLAVLTLLSCAACGGCIRAGCWCSLVAVATVTAKNAR